MLQVQERNSTIVRGPAHELWDYDYYVEQKGDPETNGLKHTVITYKDGKREVYVPAPPVRQVFTEEAMDILRQQKVDDDTLEFLGALVVTRTA